MNNATKIEVKASEVVVDAVKASKYQKEDSLTAHMKQVILTRSWYQAKQVENSMTHNIYSADDFGESFEDKPRESKSTRMAFILVPKGSNVESVSNRISAIKRRNEAISKALEEEKVTEPIELSKESVMELDEAWGFTMHKFKDDVSGEWIQTSVSTLHSFQITDPCCYRTLSNEPILTSSQEHAISIGQTTKDIIANSQAVRYSKGDPLEGQLIRDNFGKVQYRSINFSAWHIDDVDRRVEDRTTQYLTPEIADELGVQVPVDDEPSMLQGDSQGQQA